jgi:hypothetical protein
MVRYKKLARDINSNPVQYRTWVDGYQDFDPQNYTGYKSGKNDFIDPSTYMVDDPLAIVDFNLPDPKNWSTTRKVLPHAASESQLAIIDGYIYLFGSHEVNTIYRAHVNNPAHWIDTGISLPKHLYGSQIAVIGDSIYMFGGIVDGYASDEVYTATTSDPLTWTNQGSYLPYKVGYSQLLVLDNYIYLLGGISDGYIVRNNISFAAVSDPLTWYDNGYKIAEPLYRSQVGVLDGYVCLFGGQIHDRNYTKKIYTCPVAGFHTGPWSFTGSLPFPVSNAQFARIGDDGYLFGTIDSGGGIPRFTSIMTCHSTAPNLWILLNKEIPGEISSSQLAIVYDRIFLFGGNGSSIIFAENPIYKYDPAYYKAVAYGALTRTIVQATVDNNDLFKNLGFPWWKTDYKK